MSDDPIDSDEPFLENTHFPDNPRLVRPDVRIARTKPGGPTQVYLGGERVVYPIVKDGITVQRQGPFNVLTVSFIVGDVTMDSTPRLED